MALWSRASCDIASNTVTGSSEKILFIERSANLCRQACGLPSKDSTGEVLVIGKAIGLRGQRGRHRALAGATCEDDLLARRIGQIGAIEARQRHHDGIRIGLDRDLV